MGKTIAFAIRSLIVIAVFHWIMSSVGEAATIEVDCSSASLQAAVDTAKPGDTLLVSGTCKENVVVHTGIDRITLDGQGKAKINGQDKTKATVSVIAKDITIKGFTISGGRQGVLVRQGGYAAIDGNTIQGGELVGIGVLSTSSAVIVNNTVQNNGRVAGIAINHNSYAEIGITWGFAKTASPNIIQNNNTTGILVTRSSAARIVGNTISNNERIGVVVSRGSHAEIDNNTIDGNGRGGILVNRNSGADLGTDKGKRIRNLPNKTTANNGRFGIRCSRGGYVDGRLGTLIGEGGEKSFEEGCVDSLKP
jgi:parallel beta-helix repeat protein